MFAAGQQRPPGSGKKKGQAGGRAQSLMTLDKMLADAGNQTQLRIQLQEYFESKPIEFFKTIVMPLLPKEHLLAMSTDDRAPVRLALDVETGHVDIDPPAPPAAAALLAEVVDAGVE